MKEENGVYYESSLKQLIQISNKDFCHSLFEKRKTESGTEAKNSGSESSKMTRSLKKKVRSAIPHVI
jgi:hypothetical protein